MERIRFKRAKPVTPDIGSKRQKSRERKKRNIVKLETGKARRKRRSKPTISTIDLHKDNGAKTYRNFDHKNQAEFDTKQAREPRAMTAEEVAMKLSKLGRVTRNNSER